MHEELCLFRPKYMQGVTIRVFLFLFFLKNKNIRVGSIKCFSLEMIIRIDPHITRTN